MRRFGKKAEIVSKSKMKELYVGNTVGNEYNNEYELLFDNHHRNSNSNSNNNNTYNAHARKDEYQHADNEVQQNHKHTRMVRLSYLEEANLYNTLHVNETSTSDEIRNAYKKLCMHCHPDKGGDSAMFQKLQNAYTILMFPLTRRIYDKFGSKSLRIINDIITEDKLCANPELLSNIDNYDLEDIECYFNLNSNNYR